MMVIRCCLIPAGALSLDHSRWIGARPNLLFPVAALSQVFRGTAIVFSRLSKFSEPLTARLPAATADWAQIATRYSKAFTREAATSAKTL
jgi:hypothetical protein